MPELRPAAASEHIASPPVCPARMAAQARGTALQLGTTRGQG